MYILNENKRQTSYQEADGPMRLGGGNITTYPKLILDDMNIVQIDKAYKQEDIIPLVTNRELWKKLSNSI